MKTHNIVIHVLGSQDDEILNDISEQLPTIIAKNFVCNVAVRRSFYESDEIPVFEEAMQITGISYYLIIKRDKSSQSAFLFAKKAKSDIENHISGYLGYVTKSSNKEVLKRCVENGLRGSLLSIGNDFSNAHLATIVYSLIQDLDLKDDLDIFNRIPIEQGAHLNKAEAYINAQSGEIEGGI